MSDTHEHTHDAPTMGPVNQEEFVPDNFKVMALERRVMALTNEKFALENALTQAEARNLFQSDVISALKNQLQAAAGVDASSNGHHDLDADATIG
jgi:hypothetical protein